MAPSFASRIILFPVSPGKGVTQSGKSTSSFVESLGVLALLVHVIHNCFCNCRVIKVPSFSAFSQHSQNTG